MYVSHTEIGDPAMHLRHVKQQKKLPFLMKFKYGRHQIANILMFPSIVAHDENYIHSLHVHACVMLYFRFPIPVPIRLPYEFNFHFQLS